MMPNEALFSIAFSFVPEQLRIARELRGLLKHELAARIGKSPSAVSQFESGRSRPEPQTVSLLSLALGVTPSFFSRKPLGSPLQAERCQFRRQRAASVREQRYVVARAELLKEVVQLCEEEVAFPEPNVPHPPSAVVSDREIEDCAEMARRHLGLKNGPIGSVVNELESAGVIVAPMEAGTRRVDAFSTWVGPRPLVYLVRERKSATRARFDGAHEFGHLVMHADVVPGDTALESQADKFASAFLMPRSSFGEECPTRVNFEHLLELKRRWKVSLQAILMRGRALGRFSEASVRRAYIELNARGWRHAEPDEPPMEEPNLIQDAIANFEGEEVVTALAAKLGISAKDLTALLAGSELPDLVVDEKPIVGGEAQEQ